jgi:hypothetical protein
MSTHVDKCVGVDALMTDKNRKELREVSGRLWHDNIDLSIVGPDILLSSCPHRACRPTDTQLAVIMPQASAHKLDQARDRRQNSAFVIQITF